MTFPLLYQAHYQFHQDDISFWLSLASHFPGDILETGCGTGRVLIPLAKAGFNVTGLDIDRGMLSVLKQQLVDKKLAASVNLLQADFANFYLEKNFTLIMMTCNTYSACPWHQRLKILGCVSKHLRPNGCFTVSLPNPEILYRLPKSSAVEVEEVFPHPLDGEPVQVSSEWRRDQTRMHLKWHYDHLLPDGRVDRLSIQVTQYITFFDDLGLEFKSAGFSLDNVWGDFNFTKYSTTSPYLIIQAMLDK